ncbi:flocculation protein FLO11-like isoform X3 [Micropterus dolomieu]|uniref:flocculation protein FLO11-like isoform X3 n=1 Tax=Micropterus dolomieu TaxID=147949 RepID=UPI001E8CB24D|nr:flocculation protein FLO11-like isoform X3 [Micropterus dolomieu]
MATETPVQTSDEADENIPPGVTVAAGTSKLKVQVGDVVGYSLTQPSGENEPLSDTRTFSTPALTSSHGRVKAKSRISGLQSALTPILKYLNIRNKGLSPEPLKHGNNSNLSGSCFSLSCTTNGKKSTGGSSEHPNSDFPSSHFGQSLGDTNSPVYWLHDECLPEITLLDDTYDSMMQVTRLDSPLPDGVPVTAGSVNSTFSTLQPSSADKECEDHPPELSKHHKSTANTDSDAEIVAPHESTDAPEHWLDDKLFPEITLLHVTHDSELSPGVELSSMEVKQDISLVEGVQNLMPSSELCVQLVAEPARLEMIQSEEFSSTIDGNVTCTLSSFGEDSDPKSVGGNIMKATLEGTRDISMDSVLENSRRSLEPSGQKMVKIQTSAEDSLSNHLVNVTHDINSSSDLSVQCPASQLSTSDMQCDTSSKNVTSELHDEPVVISDTTKANNEELLKSHDSELNSKVTQPSPAGSVNTFTIVPPSNPSAPTNLNATAEIPCPQCKTLDLPPSNVKTPQVESDSTDQATSVSKNTTETFPHMKQNCSAVKASGSCDVKNGTFDSENSLQKSRENTVSIEAGATTFGPQNNTFDTKPSQQNGTITLSETSSTSDSHQNTLDKLSPPKGCNATSSPKENSLEVHPTDLSKHNGTTDSTDPDAKVGDTPDSIFEFNPAVASGAGRRETKDHSQSDLPMTEGLSDNLGHQSMDTDNNKADTFSWDDTLELKTDSLITSTPMTSCKLLNFTTECDDSKSIGAQKKLYGDGASEQDGQVQSDAPSNIICDRKTFLTQPTAKSLLPPSKAVSQLLKYKPASSLPGRFELLTSGLPVTRHRTQGGALRNTAACDAPQVTTGISNSYNLRATTTGSKQPISGLRKPQSSDIPSSGIQRAATGLRPPLARSNAPSCSGTNQLRGPTATNHVTTAKKHPLKRGEALPIAKKKKIDAAVPAIAAETSTSCNTVTRARALKQPVTSHRAVPPKPQSHGCAKCVVHEQQLRILSEEIRRLKSELLKRSPQEGEQ